MIPGPTIIKKCSTCSNPIEQETIASGNTFGATYWTDGKCEAPMLPYQPWLVMCPHCYAPLWLDELEELGQVDFWEEERDKFKDAKTYQMPSIEDYLALLEKGSETTEKERYIRLRAWWTGNDVRRNKEFGITALEVSNLTAFAEMLDESNASDLIMKAEVMRELGRFDDAKALLAQIVDDSFLQVVAIIKNLIEKSDPYVRKMHLK